MAVSEAQQLVERVSAGAFLLIAAAQAVVGLVSARETVGLEPARAADLVDAQVALVHEGGQWREYPARSGQRRMWRLARGVAAHIWGTPPAFPPGRPSCEWERHTRSIQIG